MKLFFILVFIFLYTSNQEVDCKKSIFITVMEKMEFYINPEYIGKHNYTIYKKVNASSELDINAELLLPFYNNVTFGVELIELKNNGSLFKLQEKFCKALKNPQLMLMVKDFSNLPKNCPLKDLFQIRRLELIVDFLPKYITTSQYILKFILNQNVKKEQICFTDIYVTLINTSMKSKN